MRYWEASPRKMTPVVINLAGGLNQDDPINLADNECTSLSNMDSTFPEVLSVREGRTLFAAHEGYVNRIFTFKGQMYSGNGKGLYKLNGNTWSAVYAYPDTNDERLWDVAQFFDGSKLYFTDGTMKLQEYDGTNRTELSASPVSAFLTTHANRFFAANRNDNLLSYSGLRDASDWTSTDQYVGSGKITVETEDGETPTGLTNFAGHVILFKKYTIHELFGEDSTNFEMTDPYKYGCISDRTIVETPYGLIWLGTDRVNLYRGGGAPTNISNVKIKKYIDSINMNYARHCVAGYDGRFYYLSLVTGTATTPNVTLKYDLQNNTWWVESYVATAFHLDGTTFYLAIGGNIYKKGGSNDNGSPITWHAEFFHKDAAGLYESTIHKMKLVADIEAGSTVNVAYSTDPEGSNWTTIASLNPTSVLKKYPIPLMVNRPSEWFRFRISGSGPAKFYRMEKNVARRGI